MLCPGGVEHSGGIGRWAGYMEREWTRQALRPPLEIVDTRGFGGPAVGVRAFASALARLCRLRARGELALVHANLSADGSTLRKALVALLARALRVPLVVHLHSGRFFRFYARLPRPLQRAVRRLFARAERVIVLGSVWRDQVVEILGVPPGKIMVLPNAVGRPSALARDAPPDGVCHIVFLGRLFPPKGVPELIEALASPALAGRPWRATLAGDGDAASYRAAAESGGIADRVAFPGWLQQDAVGALLREADLVVLPSHSENLPVSVVEALAYRVAVVATPVGATPELIADGESALFVPVGDSVALAAALARLIDDPALRRRIAEAGHRVFLDKLDAAAAARSLVALYKSVLHLRDADGISSVVRSREAGV
jgi:glycosyltransferase involved in cell wall biosynthesis